MIAWAIEVAAFWCAMAGVGVMLAGMAMMWFAPVQTLAFRSRFKLSLVGTLILLGSVAVMVLTAMIEMRRLAASLT